MSTYGIKRANQHTAETQPFTENLCVASFLLTLRNGLVALAAPEGGWRGLLFIPQSVSAWRIQDTETQRWAGLDQEPERQLRRPLLLINR